MLFESQDTTDIADLLRKCHGDVVCTVLSGTENVWTALWRSELMSLSVCHRMHLNSFVSQVAHWKSDLGRLAGTAEISSHKQQVSKALIQFMVFTDFGAHVMLSLIPRGWSTGLREWTNLVFLVMKYSYSYYSCLHKTLLVYSVFTLAVNVSVKWKEKVLCF